MVEVAVVRATEADLPYLWDLSHTAGETIGFIPAVAYARVVAGENPGCRLWLATVDEEPVGFLYASPGARGGSLHIAQCVVQEDARRREYATALVQAAETYAQQLQRLGVRLRVGAELEATAFWVSLGYQVQGEEAGGLRRGRTIQLRTKALPGGLWSWS